MNKTIYYRKKDKKIIIEGKQDGKSIFIWTLPDPETLLNILIEKASFFEQGKVIKIVEKLERLDVRKNKGENGS